MINHEMVGGPAGSGKFRPRGFRVSGQRKDRRNMVSEADLHMHSSFSDGSDTPSQLLEKIQEIGVRTFALTDHDTIRGVLELKGRIPPEVRFIPGIEFSTENEMGKFHILGLNFHLENLEFQDTVKEAWNIRMRKLERRIRALKVLYGIEFSSEEIDWLHSLSCPGRPHMAQLLIRQGKAKDIKDAFHKYLHGMDGVSDEMDPRMAVEAINHADGISIWAHPLGEERKKFRSMEETLRRLGYLKQLGIQGIECYYSRYDDIQQYALQALAERNQLLVSGGSDYHGTHKPNELGVLNIDGKEVKPASLTVLENIS